MEHMHRTAISPMPFGQSQLDLQGTVVMLVRTWQHCFVISAWRTYLDAGFTKSSSNVKSQGL